MIIGMGGSELAYGYECIPSPAMHDIAKGVKASGSKRAKYSRPRGWPIMKHSMGAYVKRRGVRKETKRTSRAHQVTRQYWVNVGRVMR